MPQESGAAEALRSGHTPIHATCPTGSPESSGGRLKRTIRQSVRIAEETPARRTDPAITGTEVPNCAGCSRFDALAWSEPRMRTSQGLPSECRGSSGRPLDLPAEVSLGIQKVNRPSAGVGKSSRVEPWDSLLVRKHDHDLEFRAVEQKVRKHDGRQRCLGPVWNSLREHGLSALAVELGNNRISVAVWNFGRRRICMDSFLVQQVE